jgi:hypothetical protein
MQLPPTKFIWNLETDVERVANICVSVANGWFNRHGFVVVPESAGQEMSQIVLPRLNYQSIPHFWQTMATEVPEQFPIIMPVDIRQALTELVRPIHHIHEEILEQKEAEWRAKEVTFWSFIADIFPKQYNYVGEVEIRLSPIGSGSSYGFLTKDTNQKLIVYLRTDYSVTFLAEVILSSLLSPHFEEFADHWRETEAPVDMVLSQSRLFDIFPDFVPTLASMRLPSKVMQNKSRAYTAELGMVLDQENEITMRDDHFWIEGKDISFELSVNEKALLQLLLSNKGKVVSYDEMATVLWVGEDFFSLWALNRAISRLREKIDQLKGSGSAIQTVRGKGYLIL